MRLHRRLRRASATFAVVAVAACSGSDPAVTPIVTVAPTTTAAADEAEPVATGTGIGAAPDASEREPFVVAMTVEGAGIDEVIEVEIDPTDVADVDPFGRFAACSGSRRSFGAYSVQLSDPSGSIRSASLLTVGRVEGPGIHNADVRIEPRDGEPITAVGTITIGDDLRSGSYVAFDAEGRSITGSFDCRGGAGDPVPISPGPDDGVVDSVEVFVLLRRDRSERLVGFAVDGGDPAVEVECPGAVGAASDLLVRVDGELSEASPTTFELVDGATVSMRLRAGGATLEFPDAEVVAGEGRVSGTFTGVTADGTSADGAFACS